MSDLENIIAVTILDRVYKIKCPAEQAHDLQDAAKHVDDQMRKLRNTGNISNADRIAVVTALNICHDLMQLRKQKNQYIDLMSERIKQLHGKIELALASTTEDAL